MHCSRALPAFLVVGEESKCLFFMLLDVQILIVKLCTVQASQITQAGNFSIMIPLHKYTLPTSNLEI